VKANAFVVGDHGIFVFRLPPSEFASDAERLVHVPEEVTEKSAIVIGLFSFAIIEQLTNNIRYSALCLGIFFVVGLALLGRMQVLIKNS